MNNIMEVPDLDINLNSDINTNLTLLPYILDPLSVIIKLSILSKKNVGCKICITNNILYIQEVGIFQSLVRRFYNNTKNDIQYLYNPIELACNIFLNIEFVKDNPKIKKLFISAQKGIDNLIETYKNHTIITHTLFMYYNIISNYLGKNYNDKLFIPDNLSNIYTKKFLDNLNSMWNINRIKIVLDIIDFIDHDKASESSIKCLEEFMASIDKDIILYMKK
jgi:hypothetical protein